MTNELETTYPFQATLPEYQFRSTSTCPPVVGYTSYTSTEPYSPMANAPRPGQIRRDSWGEGGVEEEAPVGVIPVSPVGEVPMALMIVMAFLYLFFAKIRKKSKNTFFNHKNL